MSRTPFHGAAKEPTTNRQQIPSYSFSKGKGPQARSLVPVCDVDEMKFPHEAAEINGQYPTQSSFTMCCIGCVDCGHQHRDHQGFIRLCPPSQSLRVSQTLLFHLLFIFPSSSFMLINMLWCRVMASRGTSMVLAP